MADTTIVFEPDTISAGRTIVLPPDEIRARPPSADGVVRIPAETITGPPKGRTPDPSKVEISIVIRSTGAVLTDWEEYTFNQNFLTPCAGFSFKVGGRPFQWFFERGAVQGARISLRIGDCYVADGYIDSLEIGADREGGIEAILEGRDRLGYAVSGNADPLLHFKDGATLEDALLQLLGRFGVTRFVVDDTANQALMTGLVSGTKYSEGGKKGPKPLKSFVLHQTKPYPGEGCFAFAARLAQRHGVWLWLSADGESVIASKPDYDKDPIYGLYRPLSLTTGRRNILSGGIKYDVGSQPQIMIASGTGGGGEFPHSSMRALVVNPVTYTTDAEMARVLLEYGDARPVPMDWVATPLEVPYCRTVYLHDRSSQTPQQLENFLRRELSLHLRKSLAARYLVTGHGQMRGDQLVPWAVNEMAYVDDEVAGYRGPLWIIGRTFTRRKKLGTQTQLELIRPHSMELGEPEPPTKTDPSKKSGGGNAGAASTIPGRERPYLEIDYTPPAPKPRSKR